MKVYITYEIWLNFLGSNYVTVYVIKYMSLNIPYLEFSMQIDFKYEYMGVHNFD